MGTEVLFGSVGGPAEVSELGDSKAQKDVLRFEIPVQNGLGVAVAEGFDHLHGVVADLSLLHLRGRLGTFWASLEKRHLSSAYSRIRQSSFSYRKKP